MDNNEKVKKPKIDKSLAIAQLWRIGNLSWKLRPHQKELYNLFYGSKEKINTWLLSRRQGKTYTLALLAIESCMKNPNIIVKFVAPTKAQVNQILRPIIREILSDCPLDLRPELKTQDWVYYFPNGSEIQLAGSEAGHYQRLRGGSSWIAIVDEAQDVTDLDDVIGSVLLPTTLTTKGKIILAGTPPKNADHDFIRYVEKAEMSKTLVRQTIYDNKSISPEELEVYINEVGGKDSEAFRRELLCVDEHTLIKTKEGYKEIKDINIGDEVFTHKGNYKPVLNKFPNPLQDRKVYKVECSNNEGLICTEGHKLYIATSDYKKLSDGYSVDWKAVEDINFKHSTKRVYFKVPIDNYRSFNDYNEDLAFLSGWHLAEGHTYKNCSVLSLNFKDPIQEINEVIS